MATAPTYATRADCLANIEGLTIPAGTEATFDRLIVRAEQELDRLISWPAQDLAGTTGTKLKTADLAGLSPRDRDNLRRATCAQVEYMIETGEAHLIVPELPHTGPDFSVQGELPRIGPKAMNFLRESGLGKSWAPMSGGRLPSRRRRGIERPVTPSWWR